ncbi:MAG: 50S ribosomal protein L30 [Candidatus Marinimicrobia bacterium]|nr:50S ribosomal protein L30 [Candidatus Neomarinimicrobiota bacterium]
MAKKKSKKIKITQIKSMIGQKPKINATIKALGLGKIRKTVEHTDNDVIRGMVNKVSHMIIVKEA